MIVGASIKYSEVARKKVVDWRLAASRAGAAAGCPTKAAIVELERGRGREYERLPIGQRSS
jgi:hypothetical protein